LSETAADENIGLLCDIQTQENLGSKASEDNRREAARVAAVATAIGAIVAVCSHRPAPAYE
jgi:hypothetical protein